MIDGRQTVENFGHSFMRMVKRHKYRAPARSGSRIDYVATKIPHFTFALWRGRRIGKLEVANCGVKKVVAVQGRTW